MGSEASLDYLEEYDPTRGVPFSHHLIAGSVAGLAEHGLLFPLDTIKTLRQVSSTESLALYQTGLTGALRLWRGVLAETAACIPAHACFFGGFETVRRLGYSTTQNDFIMNGIAGSVATIGHDTIMTPADVVKQRLQLGHHRGLLDAIRSLFAEGGFTVFYCSLPTTLAMNVPYGCISVAVNEWLKLQWRKFYASNHYKQNTSLSDHDLQTVDIGLGPLLISGGIAGAFASLLTTPLDVIKTRLQTQGLDLVHTIQNSDHQTTTMHSSYMKHPGTSPKDCHLSNHPRPSPAHSHHHRWKHSVWQNLWYRRRDRVRPARRHASAAHNLPLQSAAPSLKYHGFADAALSLWREEGLMAFFRGATVRAIAQAPSVAIVWTTYELFIKLLQSP